MTEDDTGPSRRRQMLLTALGPEIGAALHGACVTEIMVNPDGKLWLDELGTGRRFTGLQLAPADTGRIIRLVAAGGGSEASPKAPIVSCELPVTRERFEGLLPPVVEAPCFSIRKAAVTRIALDNYVGQGVMTEGQAEALKQAVRARKNILIAGGTSSGKTTLANALLAEIATLNERVIILEDTRELVCAAEDHVALKTKPGLVSLADLVRSTLRLRPDRIIIGEVRGGEALEMLKAWNTGHAGGIATVHANSAAAALTRLEQLVQEAAPLASRALIADAIDIIIHMSGRGEDRCIGELVVVTGLAPNSSYRLAPLRF